MKRFLIAAVASLAGGGALAHESSSAHYVNLSGGGEIAVRAAPAPAPAAVPRARTAPRPVPPPPKPLPVPAAPTPPARRPWAAWTAAAAMLGLVAATLLRRRDARRARATGETLALAAHELKSPLAAIESYLDVLAIEAPGEARDARRWLEDVRRMKSTAAHLRRTIGDILDMTRMEDGRLKLALRRVPLAPLLAETAAEYAARAKERGVALSVDVPPELAPARADPDRLRQILHNLIGNALKFTPEGRAVRVAARAEGSRLLVEVHDEGVGVPAEKRDRLFGKFARLAPSLDETEGTGLGLYISRRLAEAQQGRLSYVPGPGGRGSVFQVSLPKAEDA